MAIFAFNPFIDLITPAGTYQMNCMGINLSTPSEIIAETAVIASSQNYIVAILAALIVVMSVIAIFLFKNRMKQMLVCKINILFYITLYVVMGLLIYNNYTLLGATTFKTTTFIVFPICSLITNGLAISAINKDEQMVRDSERMWTRNR
jgi:hypothetical protein